MTPALDTQWIAVMAEPVANPNFGPVRAHLASVRTGGTPRFVGSPSFHGAVFLMLVWFALASLATVLFPSPSVEIAAGIAWLVGATVTWLMQRRHWQALRREYLAMTPAPTAASMRRGQLGATEG